MTRRPAPALARVVERYVGYRLSGLPVGVHREARARVARFDRARRMITATPPPVALAQVAALCGYYDQAHLTRDFVALAGCSPGRLADGDLPSFQDPEAVDPRP